MNRRAILTVVSVFVLGMLVGGLAIHLVEGRVVSGATRGGPRGGPSIVQQLTLELNLDGGQQKQLETVLEETRTRYEKLHETTRPERDRIRLEGRDRIRAILSPAQVEKFNEFVRQIDERRNKKNGR
jgi:hypothetical protein